MGLICDIFNVSIIDDSGNIIATDTLQSADIEISVQENEVRAGRGNSLISILHSDRDINLNLSDAEFRWDWLQKQFGTTAKTEATTAWASPKWYKTANVEGSIKITLDETPLASDSGLKIYTEAGVEISSTTYTVSGKTVTFTTGTAKDTDVEVRGYKYTTAATASSFDIDNSIFADGVICVLETLEINRDETPEYRLQYVFDECLPTGNITISTISERTANAMPFNLRVIKPRTTNVVGRAIRIPIVSS